MLSALVQSFHPHAIGTRVKLMSETLTGTWESLKDNRADLIIAAGEGHQVVATISKTRRAGVCVLRRTEAPAGQGQGADSHHRGPEALLRRGLRFGMQNASADY